MTLKTKTILSLICNAVVLLVTAWVVTSYFIFRNREFGNGAECFMFFTTDSNILAAVGSGLVMICDVKILQGKRTAVARPFTLIKYAGVVSLMLTFFVVIVLLLPTYGAARLWGGTGFHMHVAAPILTFISFVFLEEHTRMSKRDVIFGVLPAIAYGAVYFLQVVVFKDWLDFYTFNRNGMWYVTMPVILGMTTLMSALVRMFRNKAAERRLS